MDALSYIITRYSTASSTRHNAPIVLPIDRDELAVLFNELDYKIGAEIGVAEGEYSEVLCKAIPGLNLYCIDAWQAYGGYNDYKNKERFERFYATAQARLIPYGCTIIREFSVDAVKHFINQYFDFVYIDAAHDFLSVTQDIAWWSAKVRKGGIVAGHDYKRDTNPTWRYHVKDVVPTWAYAHRISPWFITTEHTPSWFWVKA